MALRTFITRKTLGLVFNNNESRNLGLGFRHARELQTFSLPDLPYDYSALEPVISGEIMQIHHQKHHQAYITNYNKALEQLHEAMEKGDSSTVVKLQSAIKFNGGDAFSFVAWNSLHMVRILHLFGALTTDPLTKISILIDWDMNSCSPGLDNLFRLLDGLKVIFMALNILDINGEQWVELTDNYELTVIIGVAKGGTRHVNHSIFWKNLTPVREGGGDPPTGSLAGAIDAHFGSFVALLQKINAEGAALQGSGWVWLGLDKDLKKLVVETTANQDPLVTKGSSLVPLLGVDVWEHAYYLQYKNVRPDYLKNIWKVINWQYASEVYEKECP
ncbi:hypothetical protein GIB67_027837 [Kingdonia uniflora]|uniref:superoxide dismutase n=1 Tax=Kingdonia uniflora TaxID=39325 RepID=A0A7J7P4I5_9MAGN|nr:hypothetical protein GIB67_027837 [Kingdonia uniflora]